MKSLGNLLASFSTNTWEFLRSDRAILVWASLVGVLSGLVAVLLKNGVSLIRSGIFSAQTFFGYNFIVGLGPLIGLLLTAWFVKKVLKGDHPGGWDSCNSSRSFYSKRRPKENVAFRSCSNEYSVCRFWWFRWT